LNPVASARRELGTGNCKDLWDGGGICGRVVGLGIDGGVSLGAGGDVGMEADTLLTGDRDGGMQSGFRVGLEGSSSLSPCITPSRKGLSQSSLDSMKVMWKDSVTLWEGL
jgi:hypothetical protein